MTTFFRCLACDGVYADVQRDGALYFHACPPLPPDKHGLQPERPNRRDENIAVDRRGRAAGIRSEGAGVEPIDKAGPAEPAWLSKLKAQLAKEEEA
jgi:hypothetical protein